MTKLCKRKKKKKERKTLWKGNQRTKRGQGVVKPWEPFNSTFFLTWLCSKSLEKVKLWNKDSYSAIQRAAIVPRSKNLVMKRSLYCSEYEKYSNWEQQKKELAAGTNKSEKEKGLEQWLCTITRASWRPAEWVSQWGHSSVPLEVSSTPPFIKRPLFSLFP